MIRTLAATTVLAAASVACAHDFSTIKLDGLRLEHGADVSRDSRPEHLTLAPRYQYVFKDCFVKGDGGILGAAYPSPVRLEDFLADLNPDESGDADGWGCDPTASAPVTFATVRIEGDLSTTAGDAAFGATLAMTVDDDGTTHFFSLRITDVVVSPSPEAGALVFTSGTLYAFAIKCPGDFNKDQKLTVNDFIAFQAAWARRDDAADMNCDGKLNINDFVQFQRFWAKGCG